MRRFTSLTLALFCAGMLAPATLQATVVSMTAARDNTLYEDNQGLTSNGAGIYFFTGTTSSSFARRGLLYFNVATIPAGSTITRVEVRLHASRVASSFGETVRIHRSLASWGEGASDAESQEGGGAQAEPGDATWVHRFYSTTPWASMGGDFAPTSSASRTVGATGSYTWASTAALISDVQTWVNNPAANFGWVILGNESTPRTAKRFDTRENTSASFRPTVTIEYIPEPGSLALLTAALLLLRRR